MPRAATPYWRDPERAGIAVYAERRERRMNAVDRVLLAFWGDCRARLTPRRRVPRDLVDAVVAIGADLRNLPDRELTARAEAIRPRLARLGFERAVLPETFALVREASRRVLGIEQRPVQIHGASLLLRGSLLEMATGEGKTVTALLAAAAAALAGRRVHVVTVNEYLARRDHEELGPVLHLLGLRSGLVVNGVPPDERRIAYAADVTYVDNKEVTFDYLRDRMAIGSRRSRVRAKLASVLPDPSRGAVTPELILSGLDFAIVDEADSVLVDEAKTPLIISSQSARPDSETDYGIALDFARTLLRDQDYALEARERAPRLLDGGKARAAAELARFGGTWGVTRAREERVTQALSALHAFRRDQHYIVAEDKVQIVDEFTGRVMPDRSWEAGLHQMIEAKEGVPLTGQRTTIARITYQRFFRRYRHLCGMTGTGLEVAGELEAGFGLRTRPVPTHRPVRRRHLHALLVRDEPGKHAAIVAATSGALARGQPVLIGVRSVEASETLSPALARAGIAHIVLNARQDRGEAEIVAEAGRPGAVTVATNMAGRGTDIKLAPGIAERGGLHVILTEFHESGRVDRQLYGRAGRQGDPGSCQAIVSLDDEIFTRHAPKLARCLRPCSARLLALMGPGLLRRVAQSRAERAARDLRHMLESQDRDNDRNLSFAGRPD